MRLLLAILTITLFSGCSKSPDKVQLPQNTDEIQEVKTYINKNLDGEQRSLANQFIQENAQQLDSYANMTLEDAINKQRKDNEQRLQAEKKQLTLTDVMNHVVDVTYISHKPFESHNYSGYDFNIRLTNKQSRPIKAVKGDLVFRDDTNEVIGRIVIEYIGSLNAGESKTIQIRTFPLFSRSDYFDDRSYEGSDVSFLPQTIIFADDSIISAKKTEQ